MRLPTLKRLAKGHYGITLYGKKEFLIGVQEIARSEGPNRGSLTVCVAKVMRLVPEKNWQTQLTQERLCGGYMNAGGPCSHTQRVMVSERNLLEDAYGSEPCARHKKGSTFVHEVMHLIYDKGIKPDKRDAENIATTFHSFRTAGRVERMTPYRKAKESKSEFFAEAGMVYFAMGRRGGEVDARWLERHAPRLYSSLTEVFGPPKDLHKL